MKITHSFWVSAALSLIPAAFAQSTVTSAASSTTTSAAPSCTASLITKLCDYKDPVIAAAIESKDSCLAYCDSHQPCSFAIFAAGNPYTGTGTCWIYPGESYDASAGTSTGCSNPYLSVYDKPVCAGTPTSTAGACAATASPSAVASICGYSPPDTCSSTCVASSGATHCLSACAEADACTYAVFNPRNSKNSPYLSGTCWIYTSGTYDAGNATTCSGAPEQYVYTNPCPKPPPSSSSSASSSATASASGSGTASGTPSGTGAASATQDSATDKENSAANVVPLTNFLALGLAVLVWQGLA
ncbi:unnamed protein product [Clonostachys rosea f. rosea IK726]|uniref:Apple domain-containing protein n=2 Tax=Bionectria ochroleuca TaxID=29856 RepID=A0A0B7JYF8_BIOOC|nr:unnamed protein product [Clonostachys rosea f. rosea IK726]